ncbi:ABC transporter substrate-binding protein [Thermosipho ferrireducens]|uniref:ABC transporter substrate-binding protein n=1 Tax=Thermosipho ferrireducens TaxID=2571116 RepID=A0ABX7S7I9_9BACT|nr:ABC transporter substrate-binding protein [Thermosipho ferrireducens]QTA37592.1 ABC transporter substrate-binding protein [Thermosipho ferrireducens]
MKRLLVFVGLLLTLFIFGEAVVNYALLEDITTTNIWNLLGSGSSAWNFYVQLWKYPALLTMNKDGMLIPSAAAEVPKIVEENGMYTVTVKLRKDLRWSDGSPFTANDVVFTYNTIQELQIPGGNWVGAYEPTKVEKIDEWTVKFYFKEKTTMTIYYDTLMTAIVSKNFWAPYVEKAKKQENPVNWLLSQEVVDPAITALNLGKIEKGAFVEVKRVVEKGFYLPEGEENLYYENGGFVIKNPTTGFEWTSNNPAPEGSVKLKVVNGPYIDKIIYRIYGNKAVALQALQKGDVDFVLNPLGLTSGEFESLKGVPGIKLTVNPSLGFRYLAFNMRKYPFNIKEFRQALAALIDRDYICNRVLQGKAIPLSTPVPPANTFWYNADVKTIGEGLSRGERYQLAIELLKKAGFSWDQEPVIDPSKAANPVVKRGKGLKGPDGKYVPDLELLAPSGEYDPMRATTAIYIEQWAKDLGLPIDVKLTDFNEIVTRAFDEVDFDMYMLGWGIGRVPTYFKSFWKSDQSAPEGFNTPGYSNPEFDALIDEFEMADSFDEAVEAIKEAQELLAEDLPYIILFTTPIYEAYRDTIEFPFTDTLDGIQNYNGFPENVVRVK